MITTAFLNQKGGVGKTSLCHHLAGALADLGKQVLLVDYDPQASLTQGFLGPDEAAAIPFELTAATIASGNDCDPCDLVRGHHHGANSLLFVPGSRYLAEFNLANPYRFPDERPRLRRFLAEAAQEFRADYCLVDCPPNLSMCAAQALAAAEFLVIPTQPEDYGAQGLDPVLKFAEEARDNDNPFLKLAGIAINLKQFTGGRALGIHTTFEKRMRDHYGELVFAAAIPNLKGFKEAIAFRLPITWFDPGSNAAEAMRVLASEFVTRTGGDLP